MNRRAFLASCLAGAGSLWSQIGARAIRGPATGETLPLVPSTVTTWGTWRDTHPDTRVLLPPPASGTITGAEPRDYDVDPYAGYDPYDGFRAAGGADADADDVERVGGRVLRFERADAAHLSADGSRWRIATGRAVDGPYAGTALTPVDDGTMFWFAWDDRHPGTAVYRADR